MKKLMNRIMCLILGLCFACQLSVSAAATQNDKIYINSSENSVTSSIDSLYAIGDGDYSNQINGTGVYAMTAEGLVKVGDDTTQEESLPVNSPEVSAVLTASPEVSTSPSPNPVETPAPVSPGPNYEDVPVAYETVKVGLHYGSTAVSEARLRNVIGSGFAFGYFDQAREFHEVARTYATDITLIPDWNWTLENGQSFGCYHVLRHGSFADFAGAQAEADRIGGFAAYYSGSYFVNFGHYMSPADASADNAEMGLNGKAVTQSSHCIVVTQSGTNRILFEFDCGSAQSFAIRPLSDGQKAITDYNGLSYYGDFQFARLSGNQFMTAVNYVDIEDYTKGVIPYEMYASWPAEALKAQALCARNYVVTNFNRYRAQGFDVTADVYSQVYKGIGDATPETNAAVESTAGKYIRYEGKLCQTFFFSSDGGATESSEFVWGTKVPYLLGVEDPYEDDVETYSKNWSYLCKPEEVQTMVNVRENVDLDLIDEVDCSYTALGNMKAMTFIDINGKTHTVSGNRCNVVMGAKSQRFQVTEDDDGNFIVKGSGWGHNCGMSQYGAYSMAKHHGKTAEEIIKFYYTGVYIR